MGGREERRGEIEEEAGEEKEGRNASAIVAREEKREKRMRQRLKKREKNQEQ